LQPCAWEASFAEAGFILRFLVAWQRFCLWRAAIPKHHALGKSAKAMNLSVWA
jgi:hypothetical protein